MHSDTMQRTEEDINNIQNVAFNACLWLSKALALPIATKLHRVMRHVKDHLFHYGWARIGDADSNESLHKDMKSAVNSSNIKSSQIASQVLSFRNLDSVVSQTQDNYLSTDIALELML